MFIHLTSKVIHLTHFRHAVLTFIMPYSLVSRCTHFYHAVLTCVTPYSLVSRRTHFCLYSGNCTAGYYCPLGMSVPNPHLCNVGHYCPEHSASSVLCPSGWYQPQAGQSVCLICPEGYYCDNSGGVVTIGDSIKCSIGYYCPSGK